MSVWFMRVSEVCIGVYRGMERKLEAAKVFRAESNMPPATSYRCIFRGILSTILGGVLRGGRINGSAGFTGAL